MSTTKENLPAVNETNQTLAQDQPINQEMPSPNFSVFTNMQSFQNSQRMAKLLASSSLVPIDYQDNIANTTIALEMSQRIGASPLAVMQNLIVIHGKPSWSAQFIIASLNSSGRFSPLRFELTGQGNDAQCYAWAYDLRNEHERINGPVVSIAMAIAEGWFQKKGSKWQTMPEIMLRYRSASFFGKLYSPEIFMGMQTAEELEDIIDVTPDKQNAIRVPEKGLKGVKAGLKDHRAINHASDAIREKPQDIDVGKIDNDPIIAEEYITVDGQEVDKETGEIIPLMPGDRDYIAPQQQQQPQQQQPQQQNNTKPKPINGRTTNPKNANPDMF